MPIVGYSRTSGFSPLQVGWRNAWWAEGPRFAALGLADAAAVSTWPDEIGSEDLTQTGANRPTYRAAGTINSQPAVRNSGSQYLNRTAADFTALAQPDTVVLIAKHSTLANDQFATLFDGVPPNRQLLAGKSNTTNWVSYAGTVLVGGASDTSAHLLLGYFAGGISKIDVDGIQTATGDAGMTALDGVALFTDSGFIHPAQADIAFVGLASGDVRTDPKWAQFKAWVTSHYGITVI